MNSLSKWLHKDLKLSLTQKIIAVYLLLIYILTILHHTRLNDCIPGTSSGSLFSLCLPVITTIIMILVLPGIIVYLFYGDDLINPVSNFIYDYFLKHEPYFLDPPKTTVTYIYLIIISVIFLYLFGKLLEFIIVKISNRKKSTLKR